MLGSNAINFKSTALSSVTTSASDVMDLYDQFNEKKKNYIATKIAFDDRRRASAAAIGAAGGLAEAVLFTGLYGLFKAFPKLNLPIFDRYITKNFDKWIGIAVSQNPNKTKLSNTILGLSSKYIWSVLCGAIIGFGFNCYNTIKNTNINGKISDNISGANGTWIASGLTSLASSPKGAEIIKNSIRKNDDRSVTVRFNGIDKEYNITNKELSHASRAYVAITDEKGEVVNYEKKFSKGDGDILAFEVAFEKYCKDVQEGRLQKDKNISYVGERISSDGDILLKYGSEKQLYYLLTGNKSIDLDVVSAKDSAVLDMYSKANLSQLLQDFQQNRGGYAAKIRLREGTDNKLIVRDRRNQLHKIRTDRDYCISSINSKYVTIANTKRTREKIDIPISKLNNYIASVQYIKSDN